MRTMNKWDYANGEYVPHRVPAQRKVSLCEADMDTIVNCASCGKELPYGETYTSMEIHTDGMGFGYAVCDECYGKEVKRRLQADKLAHYEDLEEAGRLIELPCKVGDYVYDVADGTAYETRVLHFVMFEDHLACRTVSSFPDVEAFGKRVFLTKAEAEAKLAELKGENNA